MVKCLANCLTQTHKIQKLSKLLKQTIELNYNSTLNSVFNIKPTI